MPLLTPSSSISRHLSPEQRILELKIQVAGLIFHLLYNAQQTLSGTATAYQKRANIQLKSTVDIEDIVTLRNEGKGIIIMNHHSGIFADYLPVFKILGEEILQKCIFYTHWANLKMNQELYPMYQFRCADGTTNYADNKELVRQLKADIAQITTDGGYLFLMPAGAGADNGQKPFRALFPHMVRALPDTIPVLSLQVDHAGPVSYRDMLPRGGKPGITTIIKGKLSTSMDWKGIRGTEMRPHYNNQFKKAIR